MNDQPKRLPDQREPTSTGQVMVPSTMAGSSAAPANSSPRPKHRHEQSVELHIENLVLNGFESAQRHAIGDAVGFELTRLLTERGVPSRMTERAEVQCLDGGVFETDATSNAEKLGMRLAVAIYEGLSR